MIIYKITNNINGKAYIGQTTQPLKKRLNHHRRSQELLIGKAINKYGWENFTVTILEECKTPKELDEREQYWIAFFNTIIPNGYNKTAGGNAGHKLSDEQKAKISADLKKYYSDPEHIKRLCAIRQKQYTPELRAQRSRESTGRKHTEETKAKQAAAAARRAQTPEGYAHLLAMNAKSNEIQAARLRNEQNQQSNDKGENHG